MNLRFPRLRVRCPITFSGDYIFGEGTVITISDRGWRVKSHKTRVPKGAHLTLQVSLPDHEAPLKVELAAVQWSRGREFGLVFLRMQSVELACLRRFLGPLETRASPSHCGSRLAVHPIFRSRRTRSILFQERGTHGTT